MNKILDPAFIGFFSANQYHACLKTCTKRDAAEKVGVVARKNERYDIVEYSEVSEELRNARSEQTGDLLYQHGNILVFLV